jgi:hypothetical protein
VTDVQRRALALYLLLGTLAAIGTWRWWLAPRELAAAERERVVSVELRRATIETLADFGIEVQLEDRAAAREVVSWRAPGECVEVYRVRVDERHRDASVSAFIGRAEEHASYTLAFGRKQQDELAPVIGVLTSEGEQPRVRELWWSAEAVGPSAPDFACRRRSWDPFEDALALGWPRLPAAHTWVGARWRGQIVGGRCHETVCLDPDGSFGRALPCRARPWTEQLVGADEELALLLGDWDDGHDPARPELGIFTSRELVIDEGRPLYVRAVIEQRWAGVRRELSLVRLDDCSARSLGTPADQIRVQETRAQLNDQIHASMRAASH